MEGCGSAHHWGRLLGQLGYHVRLIPAQYVKPFVKRAKNDRADDLSLCGGFTEARRIGALAAAHHRQLSLHCSGTGIALAASAHFGAGLPGCGSVEFHLVHQALFERLWPAGYQILDGLLVLPESPGLGIDLTPEEIRGQRA
jgi:L-alanine-DL-glutamate epimerase-like enolase superfamily enzyme